MRNSTRSPILVVLLSLAAAAAPAWERRPEAPEGLKDIVAGGESLTVWPYTSSDFENPSDPINLIFPNADPRAIRQELMKLDGTRPPVRAATRRKLPVDRCDGLRAGGLCRPEGWVGGAVQLACVLPGAPLGSPFRVHIRLFRSGHHTIGNAHFEFLIPGTAEHEVLSWDLAREFVTFDMGRTGALTAAPSAVGLVPPGTFPAVRRPVYLGLVQAGAGPLLASLGLVAPASGDVPIPTSGQARVFVGAIDFEPCRVEADDHDPRHLLDRRPEAVLRDRPLRLRQARGAPRLLDDGRNQPLGPLRP